MRTSSVLISAIHLIFLMFIAALGSFFIVLYLKPNFVHFFVDYINLNPQIFLKIGLITLASALLLFICLYQLHKTQYLKLNMKKNRSDVNTEIIKSYLEKYFENIFPEKKNNLEVTVLPKEKLEIIASVDSLENQKQFLLDIEDKIGKLLIDHLNYDKEFIFTLKERK